MDEVPLREHVEALLAARLDRFEDLWTAHLRVHDQEAVSRLEAGKLMDSRLEALNELRSEVIADRGLLVRRDTFDAKVAAVDARIDALSDQIIEWRGREKGLTLTASLIVGGIGLVSTVVALYFALT